MAKRYCLNGATWSNVQFSGCTLSTNTGTEGFELFTFAITNASSISEVRNIETQLANEVMTIYTLIYYILLYIVKCSYSC